MEKVVEYLGFNIQRTVGTILDLDRFGMTGFSVWATRSCQSMSDNAPR